MDGVFHNHRTDIRAGTESPEGQQWNMGLERQVRAGLWKFLKVSMRNQAVRSDQRQ